MRTLSRQFTNAKSFLRLALPVLFVCAVVGIFVGVPQSCGAPADTAAKSDSKQSVAQLNADDLFKIDHVVRIEIQVAEDDWDQMRRQSRDFMKSLRQTTPPGKPFDYVKADVTIDGVEIKGVGIRKKGFFGSLDEKRPSIKIKFSEFNPDHKTSPPIPESVA